MGPHGMLTPWLYTQSLPCLPCSCQTSSETSISPQDACFASWRATSYASPHSLHQQRIACYLPILHEQLQSA